MKLVLSRKYMFFPTYDCENRLWNRWIVCRTNSVSPCGLSMWLLQAELRDPTISPASLTLTKHVQHDHCSQQLSQWWRGHRHRQWRSYCQNIQPPGTRNRFWLRNGGRPNNMKNHFKAQPKVSMKRKHGWIRKCCSRTGGLWERSFAGGQRRCWLYSTEWGSVHL